MKSQIQISLLALLATTALFSAEPSAFGAGDLSNSSPYGLTAAEKTIHETKQNLQAVTVKSNNQANEINSLKERMDGLQSILDSLAGSSNESRAKLKKLEAENGEKSKSSSEYDKRVSDAMLENSKKFEQNAKEIARLSVAIDEMAKLLDGINVNYVKKDEFNALVDSFNGFKDVLSKDLKGAPKAAVIEDAKPAEVKKMTKQQMESEAKSAYSKKEYSRAIELFKQLDKEGYKISYVNYMLGESEYYSKNYANAIVHYKKSATNDDSTSYISTLMLHAAISMDETNDKKNAKIFYEAVVSKYPKSKEAKIAQDKLSSR